MLINELLFCCWITHVFAEQILSVILSYCLGHFVNLRLEGVLTVQFLLFHFAHDFLLLLVLLVEPFDSVTVIFCATLWITFTNDRRCEIYLRFVSILLGLLVLHGHSLFLLLLQEGLLTSMEILQVSVEHV